MNIARKQVGRESLMAKGKAAEETSLATLYPQIDSAKWAFIYGLKIKFIPCGKCGKKQKLDIPIAFGSYRGFEAEIHECGKKFQSYTYTTTDNEERRLWDSVFRTLNG